MTKAQKGGALVDSGANGGLRGKDMRVMGTMGCKVNVSGIKDFTVEELDLAHCTAVIRLKTGKKIIGHFYQYADMDYGKSIHSVAQLENFGVIVDTKSKVLGGKQQLVTPEGHVIPLSVRHGLAHMDMRPPTDEELEDDTIEHVSFTSDHVWDPSVLDSEATYEGEVDPYDARLITSYHDFHRMTYEEALATRDDYIDYCIMHARLKDSDEYFDELDPTVEIYKGKIYHKPKGILPKEPDYEALRPFLGWVSPERVKHTIENTTQWYRTENRYPMRRHYKSRFPGAHTRRVTGTVSHDTLISDTPAADDGVAGHAGCELMEIFTHDETSFVDGFPLSSYTDIPDATQDFIRKHGAPDVLMSDNHKANISQELVKVLRLHHILGRTSEPDQQNQNTAERIIQDLKNMIDGVMDRAFVPAK
jgi:hypothetical protein